MTRGKGKQKQTLGVGEIAGLKDEMKEIGATLKYLDENPQASRGQEVNKSGLIKRAEHLQRCIDEGTPKEVRGINKDKIAERAKVLESEMQENMPTRQEMDHPGTNPGAIAKHMKWLQRNDARVREYKEIQRSLNPDDPAGTSIERLRREK
jgi:hypothetical protein